MFKHSGNIKSRIAVVVAVLVFLAVGLVTAASLLLAKNRMRDVLGSEQYSTLIGVGAYIDRDFDGKRLLLRLLAEDVPAPVIADIATVQQFLESHSTLREEFSNVVAFDPDGNLIASLNGGKPGDPRNFKERDYFRDTVAYKEGVVSAPFLSKLSQRPVVLITQPVTDRAGHLKFIVGASLDLTSPRIFGQLDAVKPGKTGYGFLLAGDGTVILHPDKTRILARVADEQGGASRSTAAALRGFQGWVEDFTKAGVPALLTYRRLRTNDWIVGTVYPSAEAFAPFERARTQAFGTALVVAALAGLIGWLGISRLLRPLGALQRHVARVSDSGGDIEVFNVSRDDEFGKLSRAFYALSKKREAAEAALAALAMTDPLTGLHNRRMFDDAIALAFARAERSKAMLAVAYLDIDHFKTINDTFGHGGGDLVLIEFASRLRAAVRITDTVVRIAGDEFTVIFESFTGHADAHALGQKIIDAMTVPMQIDGAAVNVSTSIGICAGATASLCVADFIRLADGALYRAKQEGRGRYAVNFLKQTGHRN